MNRTTLNNKKDFIFFAKVYRMLRKWIQYSQCLQFTIKLTRDFRFSDLIFIPRDLDLLLDWIFARFGLCKVEVLIFLIEHISWFWIQKFTRIMWVCNLIIYPKRVGTKIKNKKIKLWKIKTLLLPFFKQNHIWQIFH